MCTDETIKFETLAFYSSQYKVPSTWMKLLKLKHCQFIAHSINNFICTNENCP
jgi:hypothetical protein